MYAIVATGGKQYKVAKGDTLVVEKLDREPGATVELSVIFLADGSQITVDADALAKARVFAEVLEHFRGEKALVFKFKKRKGYKRLRGHRQDLTRLLVQGISLTGEALKPEKTAKKSSAEAAKGVKEEATKGDKEEAASKKSAAPRKATAKATEREKPAAKVEQSATDAKASATKETTKEAATKEKKPSKEEKPEKPEKGTSAKASK
jgi:large subunit ribosomal protein L21